MRSWRGKKNCAVFDGCWKSIDLSESDLAQVIIKEKNSGAGSQIKLKENRLRRAQRHDATILMVHRLCF